MPHKIYVHIYRDFGSDFVRLNDKARDQVKALLETLQENPYDPDIQRDSFVHDERFEYPLDGGYSIFWSVNHFDNSIMRMDIFVVAIERRSH